MGEFVLYFLSGIFLFLFLRWLKKKYTLGIYQMVVFSCFFLFFLAAIIHEPSFSEHIFIVTVIAFLLEMIYVTYFLGEDFFAREEQEVFGGILMIGSAFLLERLVISQVSFVFLTANELKNMLWFFFFLFFYQFFHIQDVTLKKNRSKKSLSEENILVSFAKLKHQYHESVLQCQSSVPLLIYAIMIYENYQRSSFWRRVDSFLFQWDHKPRKLGIMQIYSKKFITDEESIQIVSKKLEKIYEKKKSGKKDVGALVLEGYSKDASSDLCFIYEELKKFCDL